MSATATPINFPLLPLGGLAVLGASILLAVTVGKTWSLTDRGDGRGDMGDAAETFACGAGTATPSIDYTRGSDTISFAFSCNDGDCLCGQFADQWSYWVAPNAPGGTVSITSMSPAQSGSTTTTLLHGAMMDPDTMADQAFNRASDTTYNSLRIIKSPNLSKLITPPFDITPSTVGRPSVILKAKSTDDQDTIATTQCAYNNAGGGTDRLCIRYIETLTVLDQSPGDVFRPPYFGTEKTMVPASALDTSILANVPVTAGAVTLDSAINAVQSPNFNIMSPFRNDGQALHTYVNNATNDGYDGNVMNSLNGALLRLSMEDGGEPEKKEKLARLIAQRAIDIYHIHKNGANPPGLPYDGYGDFSTIPCGAWPGSGGFNQGRFPVLVFGAAMLGQTGWLNLVNTNLATRDGQQCFGETGFVQSNLENRGKALPTWGSLRTTLYSGVGACDNRQDCASVGSSTVATYTNYDGLMDGTLLELPPTKYQPTVLGYWSTSATAIFLSPQVYDLVPANGRFWLDYFDRSKRQGDPTGPEFFGFYNDPNSGSVGTADFNIAYDSGGGYQAWDAYKDCIPTRDCAGM